ncbi:MAG: META domain-containing protein [Cyanobacteria bacterium SBLK]|nr:META domain-containing protein [Cyanobacteria bacterium SBLK]
MMSNSLNRTFELGLAGAMAFFVGIASAPSTIALEGETHSPLSLEDTSWQFVGWDGDRSLLEGTAITLKFRGDRLNGSSGCNGYTAIYQSNTETMRVRRVVTTRMICPSEIVEQEEAFLQALRSARRYEVSDRGQLQIFYRGDRGSGTLVFTSDIAAIEPLVGTSWQLLSWGSHRVQNAPLDRVKITLQFLDERLTGSSGCNRYDAHYETVEMRLTIASVSMTEMACFGGVAQQESRYLAALQNAIRYEINPKGQLAIFYRSDRGSGTLIFSLER